MSWDADQYDVDRMLADAQGRLFRVKTRLHHAYQKGWTVGDPVLLMQAITKSQSGKVVRVIGYGQVYEVPKFQVCVDRYVLGSEEAVSSRNRAQQWYVGLRMQPLDLLLAGVRYPSVVKFVEGRILGGRKVSRCCLVTIGLVTGRL